MSEDKYAANLIKDYKYWSLYVAENQGYLGRCVVWCKREDALDLADSTPEEREELFEILGKLRVAAQSLFKADWLNYAFLGNETRHLHCHFLPRYASERTFAGLVFLDKRWGHNYQTDHNFVTSPDVLQEIKNAYQKAIS